jgi:Mrp family chromosome partitioning ATPase
VAISVGQLLPHADVLVVTTPQTAASDVAVRSGLVAAQTGQRVIGVVENMGAMTLPDGSTLDLFGAGGARPWPRRCRRQTTSFRSSPRFRSASICGAAATREPRGRLATR